MVPLLHVLARWREVFAITMGVVTAASSASRASAASVLGGSVSVRGRGEVGAQGAGLDHELGAAGAWR